MKKIISLMLLLAVVLTVVPTVAFAEVETADILESIGVASGDNFSVTKTAAVYYKFDLSNFSTTDTVKNAVVNFNYTYNGSPSSSVRFNVYTNQTFPEGTYTGTEIKGSTNRIYLNSDGEQNYILNNSSGSLPVTDYMNTCIEGGTGEMVLALNTTWSNACYVPQDGGLTLTYELDSSDEPAGPLTEYGNGSSTHTVGKTTGLFYRYDLSGIDAETERVSEATLEFYVSTIGNAAYAIRVCETERFGDNTTITTDETSTDYRITNVTTSGTAGYCTADIKDYMNECIAEGKDYMTILLACQSDKYSFTVASMGSATPPSIEYTTTTEGALTVEALDIAPNGSVDIEGTPTAKAIATATVTNNTFDGAEGMIIIAAYEGDTLVSVNKVDWSVPQVTEEDVTAYIDPVAGATYKAFVWDSNLSPYTEFATN